MLKTFILDTNVLLYDPNAMFAFADNEVVIPIYVIEEIDNFKKELSELGRNARQVARILDSLRLQHKLSEGAPTPKGGTLKVAIGGVELPEEFRTRNNLTDDRILSTALKFHQQYLKDPQHLVIFVTKDVNLRLRADALGLTVEDFDKEKQDIEELYSGMTKLTVTAALLREFNQTGVIALQKIPVAAEGLYFNREFVILTAEDGEGSLGQIDMSALSINRLPALHGDVWGLKPRNQEQEFALNLLLDDRVKLVTLVGKAGTGKTLLALAAGLHKVTDEGIYQRLLVARPILPLGRDLGYLPGDIDEKLNPWMQPIFDNVEFLMGMSKLERRQGRNYQELIDLGILEIEPLTYIRGRSIPNQYIIIDEAQNLTPHEVKTIITRSGENTKVVLTGDPYQIDNPYVDSTNNGLIHTVNRFKAENLAGHITLFKGERSGLAELAANLL